SASLLAMTGIDNSAPGHDTRTATVGVNVALALTPCEHLPRAVYGAERPIFGTSWSRYLATPARAGGIRRPSVPRDRAFQGRGGLNPWEAGSDEGVRPLAPHVGVSLRRWRRGV